MQFLFAAWLLLSLTKSNEIRTEKGNFCEWMFTNEFKKVIMKVFDAARDGILKKKVASHVWKVIEGISRAENSKL